MEHLDEEREDDQTLEDMARQGENSGLVGPPAASKTNILNIISNVSACIFACYIMYLCFGDGVTLFSFHPVCMSIGWLILMSTAVNSLSPGDAATEWMPTSNRNTRHWILQTVGLTFTILGFIVIVTNKFINNSYHFTTLHACFGLTSFLFAITTACGGIFALYSLKFKKMVAPVYLKLIHSMFGLLTFSLGMVTMMLGLFSKWWKGSDLTRDVSLVLLLMVLVLTILKPSVKLYVRVRERITYIRASN